MRPLLLLAACVLLAGCGSERHATVRVTLGRATLAADTEDTNAIALRGWTISAPVHVYGRGCGSPLVRTTTMFDGRLVAADHPETGNVEATGGAGEVVDAHVTVACSGAKATASRAYRLPLLRCEGGPLALTELHGTGAMEDDRRDGRRHPVHAGDLLSDETTLRLHGHAVIAAPVCNDFSVELFDGASGIGSYDAYGRGRPFSSSHLVLTGDRHAGPISVLGKVTVSTEDAPCTDCEVPHPPSTVEVLTRGTRAVIRAAAGSVLVTGAGPALRIAANEQLVVTCRAACTSSRPTLVQPGEPLGIRVRRGTPLVPQYAQTTSSVGIAASSGEPEELAVAWTRTHLTSASAGRVQQEGVTIWTGTAPNRTRAYDYRTTGFDTRFAVTAGDVTHDGHDDVIVTTAGGGSANCRTFRVVAAVGGALRTVFQRANVCESGNVTARNGDLLVSLPVGPCPQPAGGAHCYGGTQTQTLRWDGRGFRVIHTRTRCVLPRLDPARSCRAR